MKYLPQFKQVLICKFSCLTTWSNTEYFKTYKRPKQEDNSYEQLKAQQNQDSLELSYYSCYINDYAFAKWNSSIYHRNSKGNLSLIRGLKVGVDVPRTININIKVPTQKYRNRCCVSR